MGKKINTLYILNKEIHIDAFVVRSITPITQKSVLITRVTNSNFLKHWMIWQINYIIINKKSYDIYITLSRDNQHNSDKKDRSDKFDCPL